MEAEELNSPATPAGLEAALHTAGFVVDEHRAWRWEDHRAPGMVVKAEFLTDLADIPNHTTVTFDRCDDPDAINLRGTGFAAKDWETKRVEVSSDGVTNTMMLRVAGLAGYLLAKIHAARERRAPRTGTT